MSGKIAIVIDSGLTNGGVACSQTKLFATRPAFEAGKK